MNQRAKELHDEALRLKPEGTDHDVDSCSFCTDTASTTSANADNQEGMMSDTKDALSRETHEALLAKAIDGATADLRRDNEALTEQVEALTVERDEAAEKVSQFESDNTRLNTELDAAQVEARTASEKVTELETEIAKRDETARLNEIAAERAKKVRELGLFDDDAIAEKAQRWAALDDDEWTERLSEWAAIRTTTGTGGTSDEKASVLTGNNEHEQSKDDEQDEKASANSPLRVVLGLPTANA